MTAFSWLIEAPGPHYLGTRKVGIDEFYWTPDATSAVRFMSEAQADGVMMAVRTLNPLLFGFGRTRRDARAVEHGFVLDDGSGHCTESTTDPDRAPGMNPILQDGEG